MISGNARYYDRFTAGICLTAALFCASCKNDPEDIKALTGKSGQQADHAVDVTLIYSQNGIIKMRAYAKDFVKNDGANPPYIDMNRDLKAEFFDSSGQVEHVLTADSSRFYVAKGDVIVWDSVKIVSKRGQTLTTSELVWNAGVQKFFTEKPVQIATATEVINGDGMEANSDFSWYKISSPKGTVDVKKGELPQ